MYNLSQIRHIERKRDSWGSRMREGMTKRWWEEFQKDKRCEELQWRKCKGPWLPTSGSKVSRSKRFFKMNKYFVIFLQNINLYWCLYCREKVTYIERLLCRIFLFSFNSSTGTVCLLTLETSTNKKISLAKSVYTHQLLYRLS